MAHSHSSRLIAARITVVPSYNTLFQVPLGLVYVIRHINMYNSGSVKLTGAVFLQQYGVPNIREILASTELELGGTVAAFGTWALEGNDICGLHVSTTSWADVWLSGSIYPGS